MAIGKYADALQPAALKWRDLAERRRAHLIELYDTGRWQHYYSREQFLDQLRQAINVADRWAMLAPRPQDFAQAAE